MCDWIVLNYLILSLKSLSPCVFLHRTFFECVARCHAEARYLKQRECVSEVVLKRDVGIIPAGRWMGSFSLQRCQSQCFEVCLLHKESQTKSGEQGTGRGFREKKLMSVFYMCILQFSFSENFLAAALFMSLMRSRQGPGGRVQTYCAATRLLF